MESGQRYAIMDIEGISLHKGREHPRGRYSRIHNCVRMLAIVCYDGSMAVFEFTPCVKFNDLVKKEQESYNRCFNLHRLDYEPRFTTPPCIDSVDTVRSFLLRKQINVILYKGGTQERDLCYALNIRCRNLEEYGVKKYPAPLHDPLKEVLYFKDEFLRLVGESKSLMDLEANDKSDNLDQEARKNER